jgi:hypothetical protein
VRPRRPPYPPPLFVFSRAVSCFAAAAFCHNLESARAFFASSEKNPCALVARLLMFFFPRLRVFFPARARTDTTTMVSRLPPAACTRHNNNHTSSTCPSSYPSCCARLHSPSFCTCCHARPPPSPEAHAVDTSRPRSARCGFRVHYPTTNKKQTKKPTTVHPRAPLFLLPFVSILFALLRRLAPSLHAGVGGVSRTLFLPYPPLWLLRTRARTNTLLSAFWLRPLCPST